MTRDVHQIFRNVARSVVDSLRLMMTDPQRITKDEEVLTEIRRTCVSQPAQLDYVLVEDVLLQMHGTPFLPRRLTIIRVAPPGLPLTSGLLVHLHSHRHMKHQEKWRRMAVVCEVVSRAVIPMPHLVQEIPDFEIPLHDAEGEGLATIEECIKAVSVDVDHLVQTRRPDGPGDGTATGELQDSLRSLAQSLLREFSRRMK